MKKVLWLILMISLVSFSAFADPRLDLKPIGVTFREVLTDDVSMSYAQRVYIQVKNVGNARFSTTNPIKVLVGSTIKNAYLYGPDNRGGSLGGHPAA